MPALKNEQHELFCQEYLKDLNATKAAERAGYSVKAARNQGPRLMKNDAVQKRLSELIGQKKKTVGAESERILQELTYLATSDVGELYDESGSLKPIHQLPEAVRRCIKSIEVVEEFEGHGREREQVGWNKKIQFWDKNKALENMGRYHKLFTDVVKVEGVEALADRLKKSRERSRNK